jgi:hypothetical protein
MIQGEFDDEGKLFFIIDLIDTEGKPIEVNGSRQRDLWGADWTPFNQSIAYESIINIRPSQNNRSMIIQNLVIRERVKQITQELIGGYKIEFR